MIFLVLIAWAGNVIVGQYDDVPACREAIAEYREMLIEQASDDRHKFQLICVGYQPPVQTFEPAEMRDA